ncbi:proline-rich family protein [Artemisia annua]|uniref:Proline-rich family protein n=1 Tax=Artemisia annua TaxID=35608 RepID=A0A2U1KZN2_ARTAN|nr:proline-rich family protein [Artemisia annua]
MDRILSLNKGIGRGGRVAKRLSFDLNERAEEDIVDPNYQPKVPISEGTSLYAQCRSWLKNGVTVESQPQYVDRVKSLPKPLPPAAIVEPTKEDDTEMEEVTENVENLSAKELLQQHVKHAKKVRAKLRNQRLQKIERYKDRLALLLPPVVDQQPKNDPAS